MPLPVVAVGVLTLAGMYKVFDTARRLSMKPRGNTSSSVTKVDPAITCPACERPMRKVTLGGVEVDECPFCGGQWFDVGELDAIQAMDPIPKRFLKMYVIDGVQTVETGQRPCLRCRRKLAPVEHKGVTIEACVSCQGVFLEHGELRDLLNGPES